jgi:hypothetical protein
MPRYKIELNRIEQMTLVSTLEYFYYVDKKIFDGKRMQYNTIQQMTYLIHTEQHCVHQLLHDEIKKMKRFSRMLLNGRFLFTGQNKSKKRIFVAVGHYTLHHFASLCITLHHFAFFWAPFFILLLILIPTQHCTATASNTFTTNRIFETIQLNNLTKNSTCTCPCQLLRYQLLLQLLRRRQL